MASDSQKRLALAVIDFLNTSLTDGTVDAESAESIEIATNCIAEAFHVDPSDKAATKDALGGQNLLSIYGVYEKLKGRGTASASGAAAGGRTSTPATSSTTKSTSTTDATSAPKGTSTPESEALKGQGNAAMQRKDYPAAIDLYTQALEVAPLNPIYLSNRAAAYSNAGQHEFACNDAELATATDPKYSKAWSRLGLALFALGDAKGSMEAYKKGMDAEGNGGSETMKKGYETAKRRVEDEASAAGEDADDVARGVDGGAGAGAGGGLPDLGALAGMFGGGGGAGGGAGGMPDLAGLMNNPMMRSMAQNLMSNPDMMNNLMNNPQLRDMANRFGGGAGGGGAGGAGGGGMPDMSALMNDPSIAEMARNFMGGMGGAGRGRGA